MDEKEFNKFSLLVLEILMKLDTKLDEAIKIAANFKKDKLENKWLNNEQVKELLGVSTRTLQNYRDKMVIPFSQHGKKIYYSRESIEKYMNDHRIKF